MSLIEARKFYFAREETAAASVDLIGLLAAKTSKVATIEEINDAAAKGWAGEI